VVAQALHLVRHAEVDNPTGVIYGRLPGFPITARGARMAEAAADALEGEPVTRIIASPLLRTQQSAAPIAERFGLEIEADERVIEAGNLFEGRRTNGKAIARDPRAWRLLRNPARPSWGEPYVEIVRRMNQAIVDAVSGTESGHVVIVTHQLPIWMVHRSIFGQPLPHDPRRRRCALSSITTLGRRDGRLVETGYAEPAAHLLTVAVDRGAT
jgi:broad specificity phosphatase PhoE